MNRRKNKNENDQVRLVTIKPKDLRKRAYGLCARVGISTQGMTPREAWESYNDYRKKEHTKIKNAQVQSKKSPSRHITPKKPETALVRAALTNMHDSVTVPALNANHIAQANTNSLFDRGAHSEKAYKGYANEILSWDISDAKKEKLLNDLHKRWEKKLSYEARHVPWTVAGPANYNAKRLDKSSQVMQTSAEIEDWFNSVSKSVRNSKSQFRDTRKDNAQKEEDWFNRQLAGGMLRKTYGSNELSPKMVADALAPIAQYDPKRFVELYEKYDKQLHFRKGTNADKLYQATKAGKYTGIKLPKKLHESDNLNTYTGKLRSGEDRIFMKFTTKPKPQLIFALKKRGWHWNATEGAWGIPKQKYDDAFVREIDDKYKKYL